MFQEEKDNMADASVVSNTNQQIVSMFTNVNYLSILGWIFAGILLIGGIIGLWIYYKDKKVFNKKITVFEIVGGFYVPAFSDKAKVVKIGKGGFEILFLKKLKCYRIAYGGRVGRDTYYFFIAKDGYWYNGMLGADIVYKGVDGTYIPIKTTNPSMRAQYTSLEKQIDVLHTEKKSFMEKYGGWIFGIIFIVISGVLLWLMFREFSAGMGAFKGTADQLTILVDKINFLIDKIEVLQNGGTGLRPV